MFVHRIISLGLVLAWTAQTVALTTASSQAQNAAKETDPLVLLDRAEKMEGEEGRHTLQRALLLLAAEPSRDVAAMSQRVARLLSRLVRSPADIEKLLAPHARKAVVREIGYRRYREVWLYQHPVPLRVVIEVKRGFDPVVREVQPGKVAP